jgi:hypothetical protein
MSDAALEATDPLSKTKRSLATAADRPATSSTDPSTPDRAEKMGRWLHRNRWFTREPVSFVGYQFVRASLASVPYGFAMAGVKHGMDMLQQWGKQQGFDDAVTHLTLADIDKQSTHYKAGNKGQWGRRVARLAASPLNATFQIAAGFTLYRFTGGIVKTIRNRLTDPENTEDQTIQQVRDIGKTIKETAKINWPAESGSTPMAAFTLGFIGAHVNHTEPYRRLTVNGQTETIRQAVKRSVLSPKANWLQNAAIWTISYSAFFEIAERLFKDQQIKRGTWPGHHNSLKKPADSLTITHDQPEHARTTHALEQRLAALEEGETPRPAAPESAESSTERPAWHARMTQDPSIGRLALRRVLPVAIGISAYAALKRVGYIAAGGTMEPVSKALYQSENVASHAKHFLKNSWREGAATTMFFALWTASDSMGSAFDRLFGSKPVVPTQRQREYHSELLAKIQEKEQHAARVA